MSDENTAFACPKTGEPLDLCSCGQHAATPEAEYIAPKGHATGSPATTALGAPVPRPKAYAAAVTTPAAVFTTEGAPPKASAVPAPATGTTSSESPGALQLADANVKPARTYKKSEERNLEVVKRVDRKIRLQNARTMLAIARAPEVDPESPCPPEGWRKKDWRIALAAWQNTREAPAFLSIAEKTYSTILRSEALRDHDPSPNLNCDIQVYVQQNTYNYEIVEAEENK